ncbi:MAG: DUF1186 domain-containing protein [Bacteroidota bacterium]
MEIKGDRFKMFEYEITGDPFLTDDSVTITPEVIDILQKTYEKVMRKKNSVVRELHDLIEKYPAVPQFKNQLATIYAFQNNFTKANEVNHWLVKEHPDYLFGKLNLANEYIANNEYEKVPEVLGKLLEIKDLYPDRKAFHVNEVVMFYRSAISYFIGIKNIKAAESRLDILKNIDDDDKILESFRMQIMVANMQEGIKRWDTEDAKAKSVKVIAKKVVEPTNDKPEFNHPEMEQLYSNSMRISHQLVNEILALPRETLISDLHKVIYDSMARFHFFRENSDWSENTHEFLHHAIFLLTDLNAENSLEVVLDILRQDEDYLDYWFSDYLTEGLWECLYVLGSNRFDVLKDFMMEPDRYSYARSVIPDAVSQISLHYPERKKECIQWFKDVLSYFISQKDNERIIDSYLNGFITCDVLDLKATELEPELAEIYNNELAAQSIAGDFKDVLDELHDPEDRNRKRELHADIFSKYDYILRSWHYYKNEEDVANDIDGKWGYPEDEYDNFIEDVNDVNYISKPGTTYIKSEPKTGRNDPCLCGSGKKFKKCHGKDES